MFYSTKAYNVGGAKFCVYEPIHKYQTLVATNILYSEKVWGALNLANWLPECIGKI